MQSSLNFISLHFYTLLLYSFPYLLLFLEPFVSINCSVQTLNFLHWNCGFMFKGKGCRPLTYSSSWRIIHTVFYKPYWRNIHSPSSPSSSAGILPSAYPTQKHCLVPMPLAWWLIRLREPKNNLCKAIPLCRTETAISTKYLSYYRMCYKGVQEKSMKLECWCTKANYLLRCKEFVSCSHLV